MLKLLLLLLPATAYCQTRPKEVDENYQRLVALSSVGTSCKRSDTGYAFVNNGLEKCEEYQRETNDRNQEDEDYERYKCKHLRVHGTISDGKCKCKDSWKGPICNEFIGCPEKYSLYNAVCTPNVCQHGGELAIGSKHLECICKPPWDGRWCERLACWRMGPKEQERRWRNAEDHCRCADGFKGDNCDEIAFCKNGELVSGRCICAEGWKGEVCERKCIPDQTCTASAIVLQLTSLLILLSVALYLR